MTKVGTDEDEWVTEREKMRPQFDSIIEPDPAREFDNDETISFFEQLAEGYGPMMIGLSMGWSEAEVKRFIAEPGRAQIITMITDAKHESVERAIYLGALAHIPTAMKLYAYNMMPHRGWADRREVRVAVESRAELVVSVRQALQEHTQGLVADGGLTGIEALQMLALGEHDEEEDIEDADLVD